MTCTATNTDTRTDTVYPCEVEGEHRTHVGQGGQRTWSDPVTVSYGTETCCADRPAFRITKTNATGTVIYLSCIDHRDECAASAAQYVSGWGSVTVQVDRIPCHNTNGTYVCDSIQHHHGDHTNWYRQDGQLHRAIWKDTYSKVTVRKVGG